MQTWTLVWFLLFPPTDEGAVPFETGAQQNLTEEECNHALAEADLQYHLMKKEELITGYVLTCDVSQ